MHWRPASSFCLPCSLRYDYILRFEDLSEEEPAFKRRLGLSDTPLGPAAGPRRNSLGPVDGAEGERLTRMYFRQLSEGEVRRLYQVYREDFLMFGYTFRFGDVELPPQGG